MNSLDELISEMRTKSLTVKWTVRCAIGPDWIGGGRNICFYLDNIPLPDSEFHNDLIGLIIDKLAIPSDSGDKVIKGKGTLKYFDSKLLVEYSTEANIPYDMAFEFNRGKEVLIEIA